MATGLTVRAEFDYHRVNLLHATGIRTTKRGRRESYAALGQLTGVGTMTVRPPEAPSRPAQGRTCCHIKSMTSGNKPVPYQSTGEKCSPCGLSSSQRATGSATQPDGEP
jgi:hypothetical protein